LSARSTCKSQALRRKMEVDPRAPVFLQTVRGVGYRLAAD
jgi:DNA-binding response OmpR family regulator